MILMDSERFKLLMQEVECREMQLKAYMSEFKPQFIDGQAIIPPNIMRLRS